MPKLFIYLTQRWKQSLGLQVETLLVTAVLGPLLIFALIYQITESHVLAVLAMAGAGLLTGVVGHQVIAHLSAPLIALSQQLRAVAAGDLRVRLATEAAARQTRGVAAFTKARVDAILIAPVDDWALAEPARAARAAGIPVIAVDATLADHTATLGQVLTDNYGGGEQAAAELIRLLPGGGRVAIIGLTHHQKHSLDREEGFYHGLAAAPGIQVIVSQHALADPQLAEQIADDLLRRYPDLDAFYATNEDAACGLIAALRKQAPGAPKRRVICWDAAPLELEALAQGLVDALIVQNTWGLGYQAVGLALAALTGQAVPPMTLLPTQLITAANRKTPADRPGPDGAVKRPPVPEGGRPRRIGFAIKSPRSAFWLDLLAGAQACAQAGGAQLLIQDSREGEVNEIGQLREAVNLMIDTIRALVQQLQQEAAVIGPQVQALSAAAATQAVVAQDQTASLEQLHQGIGQLGQTAHEIVLSSQTVAESAAETLRGVEQAGEAVRDSSLRLREIIDRLSQALTLLSQRTTQVSNIANSMSAIADETRLLALNAAIESAGAGAYGRRFGVIAGEVQSLAAQALDSAAHFQKMATTMRAAAEQSLTATQVSARGTDLSMDLVAQATSAIEGIAGLAEHTNSAVQRISAATAQQQHTNGELAGFAAVVTSSARQAAQASGDLSTVAQDLTHVVTRLQETVAFFRIDDGPVEGRPLAEPPSGAWASGAYLAADGSGGVG